MKEALTEVGDIKIGGRIINQVRFTDDTAIIAKTQEELQDMVNRLVYTGRKYGMEISKLNFELRKKLVRYQVWS